MDEATFKKLMNADLEKASFELTPAGEVARRTTTEVTVDSMTVNAEMKEASGQDYYVTTNNLGDGVLTISFDDASGNTVAGALALQDIISVENKTQGWIYSTKGATVGDTSILLVAANQTSGYPVPGAADEFEIVYRGIDRLGTITTAVQLIDDAVFTDEATFTEASSKVIAIGGNDADNTQVKAIKVDSDGRVEDRSYDSASDANKGYNVNPENLQYVTETLADITNGDDETYYYYVDMTGYSSGAFQLDVDGGSGTCTATVEASLQDDGTVASSCAFIDVGSDVFGSANWTADAMLIDDNGALGQFKWVRVKIVASTGAADDADWTIYHKRKY